VDRQIRVKADETIGPHEDGAAIGNFRYRSVELGPVDNRD
jgi:hypothetical protein